MYRIHVRIRSKALKDLQALFSFLYPQLQYTEKDSASLEQCLTFVLFADYSTVLGSCPVSYLINKAQIYLRKSSIKSRGYVVWKRSDLSFFNLFAYLTQQFTCSIGTVAPLLSVGVGYRQKFLTHTKESK